jgi:hypothetical protein
MENVQRTCFIKREEKRPLQSIHLQTDYSRYKNKSYQKTEKNEIDTA